MAGDRPQRLLAPRPPDQDRKPRLDRAGLAHGIDHPVEATLMRDLFARQEPLDQADRLLEAIQPFAEARAEVEPERLVLTLEPAAAEAEDQPAPRQVVEGRRELGREPGIAERVGRHEQPEPGAGGEGREGCQRSPALELGVAPVALVGEQVIVEPDRIEPRGCRLAGAQRVARVIPRSIA